MPEFEALHSIIGIKPKMRHQSNIHSDKRKMSAIKDDALPGDIVEIENQEIIDYLMDSGAIKEYVSPEVTYQKTFTEETSTLSFEKEEDESEESEEEDFDLGLGDEPVKESKPAKSKNKSSNLVG